MSKKFVYAVFDSKVGAFDKPFVLRSRGEALRGWQTIVNDPASTLCTHPEDFALMEIATYDDETSRFTNHDAPVNLGLAAQFKNPPVTQAPLFDVAKGSN